MALRKAHGAGARALLRVETLPPDELPSATGSNTDRSDRDHNGRFTPGNSASRSQRVHPGARGQLGLDKSDPEYRPFAAWGRRYASHRRQELAAAHGGSVSAGVGAMVESAGLALAASRFLHARGAETGDAELLKRASALANDARQSELAAWELASREAKGRPKKTDPFWSAADDAVESEPT